MRQHWAAAVALESAAESWTEHNRSSECDESADRVNDRRSCEVMETHTERCKEVSFTAHGREKPIRSPRPVANDGIDESRNGDAINQVANKTRSADHGARRNR